MIRTAWATEKNGVDYEDKSIKLYSAISGVSWRDRCIYDYRRWGDAFE